MSIQKANIAPHQPAITDAETITPRGAKENNQERPYCVPLLPKCHFKPLHLSMHVHIVEPSTVLGTKLNTAAQPTPKPFPAKVIDEVYQKVNNQVAGKPEALFRDMQAALQADPQTDQHIATLAIATSLLGRSARKGYGRNRDYPEGILELIFQAYQVPRFWDAIRLMMREERYIAREPDYVLLCLMARQAYENPAKAMGYIQQFLSLDHRALGLNTEEVQRITRAWVASLLWEFHTDISFIRNMKGPSYRWENLDLIAHFVHQFIATSEPVIYQEEGYLAAMKSVFGQSFNRKFTPGGPFQGGILLIGLAQQHTFIDTLAEGLQESLSKGDTSEEYIFALGRMQHPRAAEALLNILAINDVAVENNTPVYQAALIHLLHSGALSETTQPSKSEVIEQLNCSYLIPGNTQHIAKAMHAVLTHAEFVSLTHLKELWSRKVDNVFNYITINILHALVDIETVESIRIFIAFIEEPRADALATDKQLELLERLLNSQVVIKNLRIRKAVLRLIASRRR